MASIFTYEPNPPRVSSPWATSGISTPAEQDLRNDNHPPSVDRQPTPLSLSDQPIVEVNSATTRLEAEPQEGPVEYKLHLLLLPRSLSNASGGSNLPGSNHSKSEKSAKSTPENKHEKHDLVAARSMSEASLSNTQPVASSPRSRQQRLEQLTTQLLWRLQQSSPYHASTTIKWAPPSFAKDDATSEKDPHPATLIPGLEESTGALYEIGVTDDGTLIGLPEDIMAESIDTLKIMAASLGCSVDILRMVSVGEPEHEMKSGNQPRMFNGHHRKLWVAEAFVKPDLSLCHPSATFHQQRSHNSSPIRDLHKAPLQSKSTKALSRSQTKQIRVSLTGATMSGKSSLLGTLSTATPDNGRGKSRLSLLKHKHELASGVTSSIAQELIGYHDITSTPEKEWIAEVINFNTDNVTSWNDVHDSTKSGRLVLFTDCAGNPRYRRTAIRGLVGWAPHWTLLCIPANDAEDTSGRPGSAPSQGEVLGAAAAELDLSAAYLDLCLRLHLPLVVVITKLDLASKQGLRLTLAKILSTLKATNRKPNILPGSATPVSEPECLQITSRTLPDATSLRSDLEDNPQETVPIVLTSALNGTGIVTLHALLHELPIPDAIHSRPSALPGILDQTGPAVLFHIEDEYHPASRQSNSPVDLHNSASSVCILGGHLQRGTIFIGEELTIGPYALDRPTADTDDSDHVPNTRARPPTMTTSRSFPGALHGQTSLRRAAGAEWRRIRVLSIRNLRQPVHSLTGGQVGTVGVLPLAEPISGSAMTMIRRGMVLAKQTPKAKRSFVAAFTRGDMETLAVGMTVLVHVASVRATAKIVAARMPDNKSEAAMHDSRRTDTNDDDDAFGFEMGQHVGQPSGDDWSTLLVSFRFDLSREHVETGAQVLIVEAGAGWYGGHKRGEKGTVAGLGGFVGTVVEGD